MAHILGFRADFGINFLVNILFGNCDYYLKRVKKYSALLPGSLYGRNNSGLAQFQGDI